MQKIAEVVGERLKLEPNGIGGERSARQPRPLDRPLAFLDPLLARAALVVEGHDILGRTAHVGHDEADPGIELPRMPLDLGNDTAWSVPGRCPIAEAGMIPAHLVRGTAGRSLEQVADPVLQNAVRRQPDRVLVTFGFQKLVDLGAKAASARK